MAIISKTLTETVTIENLRLTLEGKVNGYNRLSINLFEIVLTTCKWVVIIRKLYTVTMKVIIEFIVVFVTK